MTTLSRPPARPVIDPLKFCAEFWPDVTFYREQREIIYSVFENDETYVPAGNALGKDFVAGFVALWWFLSRRPSRVVTTSVKMEQLNDVLWGEIRRFIQTARAPLPIQYNHLRIRQVRPDGSLEPNSELVGQVSNTTEGLLGRHSTAGFKAVQNDVPRTLVIFDEASGINDDTYNSTQTWAHRKLIIGNPFPCSNFFYRGVKAGDVPRRRTWVGSDRDGAAANPASPSDLAGRSGESASRRPEGNSCTVSDVSPDGYHRKVLRIRAEDSPNVRFARREMLLGREPSDRVLVNGVKTWGKYAENRLLWDAVLQCVGLDAEFYEGADVLLYPPEWLNHARDRATELDGLADAGRLADAFTRVYGTPTPVGMNPLAPSFSPRRRKAAAIGVDPAEGGDSTAMAAVDWLGVIDLVSVKTPDTSVIPRLVWEFGERHGADPSNWVIDRGGGGKQHADVLRAKGYPVRTVAFGEAVSPEPARGFARKRPFADRREDREDKYVYKNRRAEMYHELRLLIDPSGPNGGFGVPERFTELRRQMAPIPLSYEGGEGRIFLLPKNKPNDTYTGKTLTGIVGHSPDELDALVLAVHGMLHKPGLRHAGAIG